MAKSLGIARFKIKFEAFPATSSEFQKLTFKTATQFITQPAFPDF